jgi:hypothetical protein
MIEVFREMTPGFTVTVGKVVVTVVPFTTALIEVAVPETTPVNVTL